MAASIPRISTSSFPRPNSLSREQAGAPVRRPPEPQVVPLHSGELRTGTCPLEELFDSGVGLDFCALTVASGRDPPKMSRK